MTNQLNSSAKLIRQAAEKYSGATALRVAIQLIPYVGGPLDTLIGGEGQKIQQHRIAHFIDELDRRLKNIEAPKHALANEDLFDLMIDTFERVVKTRSEDKRARFAQVIANEISCAKNISDAEIAIRLIDDLDDLHIKILNVAVHAPLLPKPMEGLRVVTIKLHLQIHDSNNIAPTVLSELFPDIPEHILRLTCSELVAKGLLLDNGIGRFDATAMEQFASTDLATWLFTWLNSN